MGWTPPDHVPRHRTGPGRRILLDADTIMLVDHEYASNNDRCYELGIWFGEMFFPADVEKDLIEAYFGTYREELYARIIFHKALVEIKWALWS